MKKIVVILLIIVVALLGQDNQLQKENNTLLWPDSTETCTKSPELTHAIQLQYIEAFRFASFDGKTLSYKRFESPEKEIRYSLTLDGGWSEDTRDSESQYFFYDPDSSYDETNTRVDSRNQFSISIGRYNLRHTQSASTVSWYWGGGPSISGSFSHNIRNVRSRYVEYENPIRIEDTSYWSAGLGIRGIVGMEWRVAKPLSITVEYNTSMTFRYSESKHETTTNIDGVVSSVTKAESSSPRAYLTSKAMLGLSFYF
ncbi:MAG: hypothetical protein HQ556_11615 [Candidatus Marinimicrobia bacterium]|nr:hypothetical protein [Candidatus Neomarinimicrobiota bacterium]